METINKHINSIEDVREAYKYLSNNYVSNFTGFLSKLTVKINIRTPKGEDLLLTYTFKSKYFYFKVVYYLRDLVK